MWNSRIWSQVRFTCHENSHNSYRYALCTHDILGNTYMYRNWNSKNTCTCTTLKSLCLAVSGWRRINIQRRFLSTTLAWTARITWPNKVGRCEPWRESCKIWSTKRLVIFFSSIQYMYCWCAQLSEWSAYFRDTSTTWRWTSSLPSGQLSMTWSKPDWFTRFSFLQYRNYWVVYFMPR